MIITHLIYSASVTHLLKMEYVKIKVKKHKASTMTFEYKASKQKDVNLFMLSGELIDRVQAKELLAEIDTNIIKGESKILLNLKDLNYVNSNGLDVLIRILTKARKASGDAAICCVNNKINELLVITRLDSIFNVCASEEKAIEKLNK